LKDWVVWCRSREKDEEQRPFEANGKEIFSNHSKQAKAKVGEKMMIMTAFIITLGEIM